MTYDRSDESTPRRKATVNIEAGKDWTMKLPTMQRVEAAVVARLGPWRDQGNYPEPNMSRHVTHYMIRELTRKSYPQIGKYCRQHHTTIIDGCTKIREWRKVNLELDELLLGVQSEVLEAAEQGSRKVEERVA